MRTTRRVVETVDSSDCLPGAPELGGLVRGGSVLCVFTNGGPKPRKNDPGLLCNFRTSFRRQPKQQAEVV